MKQKPFNIIAAYDDERGLGKDGGLAWRLPADLKQFKRITESVQDASLMNAVIMGRRTWESLPEKFRPLPNRLNMVLTHQPNYSVPENVLVGETFAHALDVISQMPAIESIFVIGGAELYAQVITHENCERIYVTRVMGKFNCDVFFPSLPPHFKCMKQSEELKENGISYSFIEYFQ